MIKEGDIYTFYTCARYTRYVVIMSITPSVLRGGNGDNVRYRFINISKENVEVCDAVYKSSREKVDAWVGQNAGTQLVDQKIIALIKMAMI